MFTSTTSPLSEIEADQGEGFARQLETKLQAYKTGLEMCGDEFGRHWSPKASPSPAQSSVKSRSQTWSPQSKPLMPKDRILEWRQGCACAEAPPAAATADAQDAEKGADAPRSEHLRSRRLLISDGSEYAVTSGSSDGPDPRWVSRRCGKTVDRRSIALALRPKPLSAWFKKLGAESQATGDSTHMGRPASRPDRTSTSRPRSQPSLSPLPAPSRPRIINVHSMRTGLKHQLFNSDHWEDVSSTESV